MFTMGAVKIHACSYADWLVSQGKGLPYQLESRLQPAVSKVAKRCKVDGLPFLPHSPFNSFYLPMLVIIYIVHTFITPGKRSIT